MWPTIAGSYLVFRKEMLTPDERAKVCCECRHRRSVNIDEYIGYNRRPSRRRPPQKACDESISCGLRSTFYFTPG